MPEDINMKNRCWSCIEEFNEDDELILKRGKVYHKRCATNDTWQKQIHTLLDRYPYLSKEQITCIFSTEGQEAFALIDKSNWIIITEHPDDDEMLVHGYENITDVQDAIKRHYEDPEGPWNIQSVFNNGGQEYNFIVNISVDIVIKK